MLKKSTGLLELICTSPFKYIVDNKLPILMVFPNVLDPILMLVAELAIFMVLPVYVSILFAFIVPLPIEPDDVISPKAVMVPPVVEIIGGSFVILVRFRIQSKIKDQSIKGSNDLIRSIRISLTV